jgi:hypothetical protein
MNAVVRVIARIVFIEVRFMAVAMIEDDRQLQRLLHMLGVRRHRLRHQARRSEEQQDDRQH